MVWIHRAIKAVVSGEKYNVKDWHHLGTQCSMTERRADDATRDVTNWLKCFYMQDKVGEIFEGTVAGVTSFGLFVALDEAYVEGLLHVTELGNDYFVFDKARHEMLGERTAVRYRLGDRLTVKVARVDLETSKIDFTLVNGAAKKTSDTAMPVESAGKKTLSVNKAVRDDKMLSEPRPKTTRALDQAKKERSVSSKRGSTRSNSNQSNADKAGNKPATKSVKKNRLKDNKNKGKPRHNKV